MNRERPGLSGPIEVELAQLHEDIPGEQAMSGGSIYELKFDGYRLVITRTSQGVRLFSRNRNDLTDRFPDIAAAAMQQIPLPAIVDGEVVAYQDRGLSFDLLQQRLATRPSVIAALAVQHPASYVAFDLLSRDGEDLRRLPWTDRRSALEDLAGDWRPPMQLSPYTRDRNEAEGWFHDYRPTGIEGLVVKGAATPYLPGRRGWVKVKNRATREVLIGAVLGSLSQPEVVIAGLPGPQGQLLIVGRTTVLSPAQSDALGHVLRAPTEPHPWPTTIGPGHFGGNRAQVALTHVDPVVVAEVTADTALQGGRYRHPLRYMRYRLDLGSGDLLPLVGPNLLTMRLRCFDQAHQRGGAATTRADRPHGGGCLPYWRCRSSAARLRELTGCRP